MHSLIWFVFSSDHDVVGWLLCGSLLIDSYPWTHFCISQTEQVGLSSDTDLYFWGVWFRSQTDNGYPNWGVYCFPQSLQENARIENEIMPDSFDIHSSSLFFVIQTFSAV
jgi:hypothetical protein